MILLKHICQLRVLVLILNSSKQAEILVTYIVTIHGSNQGILCGIRAFLSLWMLRSTDPVPLSAVVPCETIHGMYLVQESIHLTVVRLRKSLYHAERQRFSNDSWREVCGVRHRITNQITGLEMRSVFCHT